MSETQQLMGILAPNRRGNAVQGRYPIPIDLDAVVELASQRLPEHAIAAKLGISRKSFERRKQDHPEIQEAIERGIGLAQAKAAMAIESHSENNPIVAIFVAKQDPQKGGLGFQDRVDHKHSGRVDHVMMPALDAWREAKQLADQSATVIEGEYEEVD